MVRKYKRKRPRQWRNKDKRMAAAVQLRAEGKSLRQIADELKAGLGTVHRDLARWDAQSNIVPLFHSPVPTRPQGGNLEHPTGTPQAAIVELRRKA